MKTAYLIAISALALMLAMCAGCDEREESNEFRIEYRSVVFSPRADDPTKYEALVTVRIYHADVLQEVSGNGVLRWVEHLARNGHEWREDVHRVYEGETRDIVSVPASVSGTTPNANGTSLLWIESGLVFGAEMAGMPVQGTVTKRDDARAIHWSIEALPDGVRVTIDGKTKPARRG